MVKVEKIAANSCTLRSQLPVKYHRKDKANRCFFVLLCHSASLPSHETNNKVHLLSRAGGDEVVSAEVLLAEANRLKKGEPADKFL